jgi:hypothetical protein
MDIRAGDSLVVVCESQNVFLACKWDRSALETRLCQLHTMATHTTVSTLFRIRIGVSDGTQAFSVWTQFTA